MEINKKSTIILFVCVVILAIFGITSIWFIYDCNLKEPYVLQSHKQVYLPELTYEEVGGETIERVDNSNPLFEFNYFINLNEEITAESIVFEGAENIDVYISEKRANGGWSFSFNNEYNESGRQIGRYALRTIYVYFGNKDEIIKLINNDKILNLKKAKITFSNFEGETRSQNVDLGQIILKPNKEFYNKGYNIEDINKYQSWDFWKVRSFLKEKGAI